MIQYRHTNSVLESSGGELARLLDVALQLVRNGDTSAIERLIDQHPADADDLRDLMPTLCSLVRLGDAPMTSNLGDAPIAEPASLPDSQLGDFKLLRQLGRGGMGVVFEAQQLTLGRRVALKVMPFAGLLDSRQVARFQNEARAAASLHHANIVPVFSVGSDRGVNYYTMQLVPGWSLDRVIVALRQSQQSVPAPADQDPLAVRTDPVVNANTRRLHSQTTDFATHPHRYCRHVANWGLQLADALEHAHQHGIIHRDIKPSNIILDEHGKPWITDFGLARLTGDPGLTHTGDLIGTVRYMSPEQASGRAKTIADHRTDIYSLGATLYELLTLQPVFAAEDRATVVQQILYQEPIAPRRINPDIPLDLQTIVLKALNKEIADRYSSAEDLRDDLRRFLDDRPTVARPLGRCKRTLRWAKRHHLHVIITAITMISLTLLVVGSRWANSELSRQLVEITQLKQAADQSAGTARAMLAREQRMGYADQLHIVRAAIENGEFPYASQRLQEIAAQANTPRDFVWNYLHRQVHCQQLTLAGHSGTVHAVAFSTAGNRLATGDANGTVRFWYRSSGVQYDELRLHSGNVNCITFVDDASFLSGGEDGTLVFARASHYRPKATRQAHTGDLFCVAISPDHSLVATGGEDGMVRLWKHETLEPVAELSGHTNWVRSLVFSPDGQRLYSGSQDDRVLVWDVAQAKLVQTIEASRGFVMSLAISPDGSRLALGCKDRRVVLWDLTVDKRRAELSANHDGWIRAVHFLADGKSLVSIDNHGHAYHWRSDTGELIRTIPVIHEGEVRTLALSPRGDQIATASMDGTARVWQLTSSVPPVAWTFSKTQLTDFAVQGNRISVCANNTIYACELKPFRIIGTQRKQVFKANRVSNSPEAKWLLAIGDHGEDIGMVRRFSAGRKQLDHRTDQIYRAPNARLGDVAYHPSGQWFAAIAAPQLFIFQIGQPAPVRTVQLPGDAIDQIAFSPDGQLLSIPAASGQFYLYETQGWQPLAQLPAREAGTFSPDSRLFAAAGDDRRISLFDVRTGERRQELVGNVRPVYDIAFSPDARLLASADDQGTIRVWDLATGRELLQLEVGGVPLGLAFSEDGCQLIAGRHGRERKASAQILIWNTTLPTPPTSDLQASTPGAANATE